MPKGFGERLQHCAKRAVLGVAELRWFFDRDYKTVREWFLHGREPEGVRRAEALTRLKRLERLVDHGLVFPLPAYMGKRERSDYMRQLGGGKRGALRQRIPQADPSDEGPVHRVGKAGGVRKNTKGIS